MAKTKSKLDKVKQHYFEMYRKWRKVRCPALNADVEFTNLGLDHITQDKSRTKVEQTSRLKLLPLAKKLIEISTTYQKKRFQNYHDHYEFKALLDGVQITVIVREHKKKFYYYSVFKE